jgi:hypothetical protein
LLKKVVKVAVSLLSAEKAPIEEAPVAEGPFEREAPVEEAPVETNPNVLAAIACANMAAQYFIETGKRTRTFESTSTSDASDMTMTETMIAASADDNDYFDEFLRVLKKCKRDFDEACR